MVKVVKPSEGGAAEKAGLKSGDILVEVGGHEIVGSLDIIKQLWYNEIGDILKVKVYRDGEFMTFDVKLQPFIFQNLEGK